MNFFLGQCWISDIELDLGLGIVVVFEGCQVSILFLVSGENRVYFLIEVFVICVVFNLGDIICSVEEWELEVEFVEQQGELLCYYGICVDNGEKVQLKEIFLDYFIKFNKL